MITLDTLPGFNYDDYPVSELNTDVWEAAGFNPLEASRNEFYCLDEKNRENAKIFVTGNSKVANRLLAVVISVSDIIDEPISDKIIDYALRVGGADREFALSHFSTLENPSDTHLETIIEIIDYYLQKFQIVENNVKKMVTAVIALEKHIKFPKTQEFLRQLLEHEVIRGNEVLFPFVEAIVQKINE